MSKKSAQLYKTQNEKQLAQACGITVKQLRITMKQLLGGSKAEDLEGKIDLTVAWQTRQEAHRYVHMLFESSKHLREQASTIAIASDMLFTSEVRKQFGQKDIEINWATGEVKS